MRQLPGIICCCLLLFVSCHSPQSGELGANISKVIPVNTNFELLTDTFFLECDPLTGDDIELYKGDRIVVADFSEINIGGQEVTWIKVAHSQELQGWIVEKQLLEEFVPTDSISQFIHFFSNSRFQTLLIVVCLFLITGFALLVVKRQIPFVYFNDIDSLYPLLLCLLASAGATLYQSILMYAPRVWQQYYFAPSLSPAGQPLLLAAFLASFWAGLVILLAVIDDVFRQLSSGRALVYMLGLLTTCGFCYIFFSFTVPFYIGYTLLTVFFLYFIGRVLRELSFRFRCGKCGRKMKKKGRCPGCGAVNE